MRAGCSPCAHDALSYLPLMWLVDLHSNFASSTGRSRCTAGVFRLCFAFSATIPRNVTAIDLYMMDPPQRGDQDENGEEAYGYFRNRRIHL